MLQACAKAYAGQDVVVVTHGGLIRAAIAAFVPSKRLEKRLLLENACINLFICKDGEWAVECFNQTAEEWVKRDERKEALAGDIGSK